MKAHHILAAVILFLCVAGLFQYQHQTRENNDTGLDLAPSETLLLGTRQISTAVADTAAARVRGLSGRQNLPENQGLLFVFEESGRHAFWMKDMHFPIDIIWLDENRTVVAIASDILPETYPKTFAPATIARYVLEVNAGVAASAGIRVGDRVLPAGE